MSAEDRPLLNVAEVSRRLGISVSTLSRMRRTGGGPPFVRIGSRRVAYNPASLADWVLRLEGNAASVSEAEQ